MHRIRRDMVCGRLAVLSALLCLAWTGWGSAAWARCGDAPGDAAAIAAVRAAMEAQCPCASATDRGSYVRCAKGVVAQAVIAETLPRSCASAVKKCATKSTCGRAPSYVTCCRTTASGKTKCRVKSSAAKCKAPSGGQSCTSGLASCCDACTATGCAPTNTPLPSNTPVPTDTFTPGNTATATRTRTITPTPTITNTPTIPAICQPNVGVPPFAQVPISLAPGAVQCGGAALTNPTPGSPFSGSVADGGGTEIGDLSLACLYAGGLAALKLPDGATAQLGVTGLSLLPALALTLGGSPGSGPNDCTLGAGPGHQCANGAPGLDGTGTCNFDGDCGGAPTSCAIAPNCYFGPPIPVPNGTLSACVVSAFQTDLCGQVTLLPPQATFATALSSRVYLTFNPDSPCPRCESGVCNGGDRAGLPCTAVGSLGTSVDCPPPSSTFLAILNVVVPELTSGVSTLTASDGLFCDGQLTPGAFGLAAARTVTENGAGPTVVGTTLEMNLAGTFCIASSGTFLDALAGLPGVGALSAVGQVDVSGLLLP